MSNKPLNITPRPSYEEAKNAKSVLLQYLNPPEYQGTGELLRNTTENLVWFALNQDHFLD